jgi:hypothetical protein
VSIVFPGQANVQATAGDPAQAQEVLLTLEALPGGTVTYSFTASRPGTFAYSSGTDPALQVEMGLTGVLIVRPGMGANYAYNNASTRWNREYLFVLSAMDPQIHQDMEFRGKAAVEASGRLGAGYVPNYFFINGRTAMDTLLPDNLATLPTQPYGSLVQMMPGEKLLMRVVGAGRSEHPFHHHGNHARVIGRQGRYLQAGNVDTTFNGFTINPLPGETYDAIFEWTGKDLGWDIYGPADSHPCCTDANSDGFDDTTWEYIADHGKLFPVTLPETPFTVVGPFYSGTPFMGSLGGLPPGEGGLNPLGGFPFMWHSHNERELTNYNIFPGGMLTMLIVQPPGSIATEY